MSDWRERAEELVARVAADPSSYEEMSALGLALVNERLDAEELRGKVWAAMPYRCGGCGSVRWYECEVGVEGPQAWREDNTYIASPYTAGRCERCGKPMTHVLHNDHEFEPREPGEKIDGMSRMKVYPDKMFRVPREPVQYTTHGVRDDGSVIYQTSTHAFLSIPMHAIQRATTGVPA